MVKSGTMKKQLILAALLLSAVVTFAQDAYEVAINYTPEKIEILPGVYEFMGKISGGADAGKDSYALSVNESLVKDVTGFLNSGNPQILYGPRLEKLVQKKIVEDYRQKRLEIERDIEQALAGAEEKDDKKELKAQLKSERKITKTAMKRLKDIVARYNVRAIYVYGRGSSKAAGAAPSGNLRQETGQPGTNERPAQNPPSGDGEPD